MNIFESYRIGLRSLAANKLRSSLTMLGIIIGVAAVVSLLSIGQGAQAAITEQIRGIGSNLIMVMPGAIRQGGAMMAMGSAATLTLQDAEALADPVNAPDVLAVAPVLLRGAQVVYGKEDVNTNIVGTTPEYQWIRNAYPQFGRFFNDSDVQATARVAALGIQTAEDLFANQNPLGRTIKINGVPFRVIGIMEEKGGGGPGTNEDGYVFIPISTAQTRLFGARAVAGAGRLITLIDISAVEESRVDAAIEQITAILRRRHRIRYQEDDFAVMSQQDFLGVFNQVTGILTVFLGAIAGISLLVGGIGIMNIMLVSVTERTREIGIRKAVGAKWRDILTQFLVEAIILSLLGGLVGILLGVGIGRVVNLTGLITTVVSPESMVLAVGFSMAVGLFFGIYPATRAASLNPIEALRYE